MERSKKERRRRGVRSNRGLAANVDIQLASLSESLKKRGQYNSKYNSLSCLLSVLYYMNYSNGYMILDLQSGQLLLWLVLNHLNRHPAWNLFLQVLQGFLGSDPSLALMIE